MATFLWGTPGAWTDVVAAASLSALANNSSVFSAGIDNTTTDAEWAEVSFISTAAGIAVTAGGHLAIYVLPQLHDGSTYPTNNTSGTALPSIAYCKGVIGVQNGTVVPTGSVVVPIPGNVIKIGMVNRLGIALNTSTTALTLRYRLVYDTAV